VQMKLILLNQIVELLVTNEIWLLGAGKIRLPVKEFRLLVADELVVFPATTYKVPATSCR
jgi:hypothetical protein